MRIAAAHAVATLIECQLCDDELIAPRLTAIVSSALSIMSSGDEEQSCGDVNFQVLTKAIEAAGETIMPFVDNITSTMSEACFAKLDEGDDILDSRALETLSELATGLRSVVVQEDEFDSTIMETAVDRILAVLERVYFDDSGEKDEEEEAKYHPLVAVILDFLCTYVTHCECAHAERVRIHSALLRTFIQNPRKISRVLWMSGQTFSK